jgi:hypothetical protein
MTPVVQAIKKFLTSYEAWYFIYEVSIRQKP